ncbi:MAG: Rnase Y domain-containing protein, partial [Candidatus Aminicenantales bacterium]
MDGIVTLLIALISAALAGTAGWIISSKFQIKKILEAKGSAKSIIEEARKEAEAIKKELILEGRDQVFKMRSEAEKEIQAKQSAVQKRESQLNQRELNIERKADLLDKKSASMREFENDLKLRMKSLELKDRKLAELIEEQNQKLERIAGMSAEEAKNMLMDNLIDKAKQDASRKIKDIKDEAVRTANREAKKIIVSAIQRTAADLSAETTVSVVSLPNDSMKGRIIGREGRNIRSFESLTGVEVIVDDTPEAVVISGFDPIRRE